MLRTTLPALAAVLMLLTGCSVAPSATSPAHAADPANASVGRLPAIRHDHTLPVLMRRPDAGSDLRRERVLSRTDAYTVHQISYRSGSLRVSGTLSVPFDAVDAPAVVLAHGYQEVRDYVSGQTMLEVQDRLARAGYVVLLTDYRNHGRSDRDPDADAQARTAYTSDVVDAVAALRRAGLRAVDPARIGLVGRSMGGGVAYNVLVTRPGLVSAAVMISPMSADAVDNVEILTRPRRSRPQIRADLERTYGEVDADSAAWQDLSASRFFDRVTEPVMIHHGTADTVCPPRWTEAAVRGLAEAGADVTLHRYPGEGHALAHGAWLQMMDRTIAFLDEHVKGRPAPDERAKEPQNP